MRNAGAHQLCLGITLGGAQGTMKGLGELIVQAFGLAPG